MMKYTFYVTILFIIIAFNFEVGSAIKCYKCTSDNEDCLKNLTAVIPVDTCEICLTRVDSTGLVTRDCGKTADTCDSTNHCVKCDTDQCNNINVCKTCNSKTDSDCSQTDANQKKFNEVCTASSTQCLMIVNADKHLERRCATDTDVTGCNNSTCKLCEGGICNMGIFPANRKRCFQCHDDTICNDVTANSANISPKPCLLYTDDDMCYTYGATADKMQRGCISDENKTCTATDCFPCNLDNCNNKAYTTPQDLKCIKCTSVGETSNCMWGQDSAIAQDCDKHIRYNQTPTCYRQTKGSTVYRGCLYDRSEELGVCDESTACTMCTGPNGCNNKDMSNFTCKRCRSDEDKSCRDSPQNSTSGECRNTVTESTNQCFSGVWNDIVIRGCLVDADERMIKTCKIPNNSNKCEICPNTDCNIDKISGAAMATQTIIFVGLMPAILLIIFPKIKLFDQ